MKKIKSLSSDYLRSDFARNALTLISGTTVAQLVVLLATPILTRIYSTEDFGVLSIYMSITAILSVVSTLRYEMAVVLPEKEEDALNIIALSFIISSTWSVLSLVAIILFGHFISDYFGNSQHNGYYFFIPLIVIVMGMIQVLNFWSIRLKNFKNNAYSRIANSVVNSSLALGFGQTFKGPFGLLIGYFFAQLAMFAILSRSLFKNIRGYAQHVNWERMKSNAIRYRNFPKINTFHALIDSFQDNGIVFFIKDLFGNSVLGSYSFAFRLLKVPTGIVSSAISQVFMEKATKAVHRGENIKPMILRIYGVVFIVGGPFFLVLFLFTPTIFSFVFSDHYRESGEIAQVLIPWLFLNFIANAASGVPVIFNRLHIPFLFTLIDICLKIISLFVGWYFESYYLGFLFMSISCSLLMLVTFWWILSLVSENNIKQHA